MFGLALFGFQLFGVPTSFISDIDVWIDICRDEEAFINVPLAADSMQVIQPSAAIFVNIEPGKVQKVRCTDAT